MSTVVLHIILLMHIYSNNLSNAGEVNENGGMLSLWEMGMLTWDVFDNE